MIQILTIFEVAVWAGLIVFLAFALKHELKNALFSLIRKVGGDE